MRGNIILLQRVNSRTYILKHFHYCDISVYLWTVITASNSKKQSFNVLNADNLLLDKFRYSSFTNDSTSKLKQTRSIFWTFKMKLFAKRVNSWTFFAKGSILRCLTGFWICLCKQQTKSLNSYKSFFPGEGLSNYIIRDCIHALYEFTQINSLLFPLKIRENLKQIKNR